MGRPLRIPRIEYSANATPGHPQNDYRYRNGNDVTASAYYGYGSTDISVATALTAAINSNQSMPVTASRSGTTITLTAKTTGASTNYSLSAGSTTYYPQYFSPSFTATRSGPNLTGGSDGGGGGSQNLTFSTSTNRITTSGYGYDSAGNLTNDTIHSYSFDAENKIVKVDNVTAYVYDGAGQRVKKLVGESTRFIYGIGGQLIAEFDGSSGNLKKEYVYGGATLITIEPAAVNSNGTQYATLDHLGSPRVMTNSGGSVASRHDNMPFGEELPAGIGGRTTAMGFSNAGDTNRKKFTGYEADGETGLNFAQARYQSPVQGRFTSVDPLMASASVSDPQSLNRYSYVGNDPLNKTDPSGLMQGVPGWSEVENGFWGKDLNDNGPHFGGPEAIGFALMANQSGVNKSLADLKAKSGGANGDTSDDPEIVRIYTVAFHSRQEAIEYYEREFGGSVAERNGKFFATGWFQRLTSIFSHGFAIGTTIGASGGAGLAKIGIGGTASSGVFVDHKQGTFSAGNFVNGGVVAGVLNPGGNTQGPLEFRRPRVSGESTVTGLFGGFGPGGWISNAATPDDVNGPFQTMVIGTPLFGLEVDQGNNGIFVLSVTKGLGAGSGVYRGPTNTKVYQILR